MSKRRKEGYLVKTIKNDYYIVCAPVAVVQAPDNAFYDHVIEECPNCKCEIWVSARKRELRDNIPKLKVMCGLCIVVAVVGQVDEVIDISKI